MNALAPTLVVKSDKPEGRDIQSHKKRSCVRGIPRRQTSIDQSVVVPLLIVVFGSAALVWARAGTAPTGSLVFGLIGSAVYLVLAYSLLFLAISSLSRSLGSELLSSVLFFLLFGFFWSLIAVLTANLAGPSGSVG